MSRNQVRMPRAAAHRRAVEFTDRQAGDNSTPAISRATPVAVPAAMKYRNRRRPPTKSSVAPQKWSAASIATTMPRPARQRSRLVDVERQCARITRTPVCVAQLVGRAAGGAARQPGPAGQYLDLNVTRQGIERRALTTL